MEDAKTIFKAKILAIESQMIKISSKSMATASVASICMLLFTWVIPNTIALRHLLLFFSCISAVEIIRSNWDQFRSINIKFLPLFFVFSIFIWMMIHYFSFSLNQKLELDEMRGLWIRSFIGAIAAIGATISIVRYPKLRLYFYIALFSTPAINVASYCWYSYLHGGLARPNDFIRFLFTKIETAYFGGIAAAVATGNLMDLMVGGGDPSKKLKILWWFLGLALTLLSALVSSTKNGIAITLSLCFLLAAVMLVNIFRNKSGSRALSALVMAAILLLAGGIWESHGSLANKGWSTVFQDAILGLDIDTNLQWQKIEGSVPMPLNSLGEHAVSSTYTRFAYAAAGARLISKYPMGYGSINSSFSGLLTLANIPHEFESQAHSGWIDFGLAFGIPGLVLIFSAMISIIYFGMRSRSAITLPWVIVFLALIPFGLIAEITWKQYFEATIFFLAVGSTTIIFSNTRENF